MELNNELNNAYIIALKSHEYKNNSIKKKIVGNWIVSLQKFGYGSAIYIYNKITLQEHYKKETIGMNCIETAPDDIKAFYNRILNRDFNYVVKLAESWK